MLLRDALCALIVAKAGEFRVAQMIAVHPLEKFDARYNFGPDPVGGELLKLGRLRSIPWR